MKGNALFGVGLVVGLVAMTAVRFIGGGVVGGVTYMDLPLSTKITEAPLIVTGTVSEITPARWNQDDGTFWEVTETDAYGVQTVDSAVPYHTVVLKVDRALANRLGFDADTIDLTVVGMDSDQAFGFDLFGGDHELHGEEAGGVISLASDTISATEGERVIAFVRPGQLAWRDGTMRSVLVPMGAPGSTIVSEAVVNSGALAEVISFDALVSQVEQEHAGGPVTE